MNALAPLPQIIPENAPFSTEQRAWLNGFFAAYLGMDGGVTDGPAAEPAEPEDFPWHDAALSLAERLELAKHSKPERQLMAAMAQLDCGQCGYLCQT
jgi:sulfite reductase (NADPH) flavoprotein alpha-component